MKKRNVFPTILIIVGIILMIVGGLFAGKIFLDAKRCTIEKGNIEKISNAYDNELDIEVESPILVREVKMAQWYKDDKGVRMVLANYPIDSFSDNGNNYSNPKFYDEIESKVFYGEASINGVNLSQDTLASIAYGKVEGIEATQYADINPVNGFKHNMVAYQGSYITASNDWKIGEVKITYYYFPDESLSDMTIAGNMTYNQLNAKTNSIYKGNASDLVVQHNLCDGIQLYVILFGSGVALFIIGLIISAADKKKLKNKR